MADETLYVIDRIVTKPGCGRQFVDALLDQYLPSAQVSAATPSLQLERNGFLERVAVGA